LFCFFSDNNPHSDCGDEDSEGGMQDMTEMRFVPDDKGMLDAMFHAMSECQSLHPDSQDSFSEGLYTFSHIHLTVSCLKCSDCVMLMEFGKFNYVN
jgi:hypothetical protein